MDHKKLWTILKMMGIPDHFTCLLRNLDAGQEAIVITLHKTMNWLQIGKRVRQGYIYCDSAYLTYMRSTSYEMPDWMNPKLELRLQEKYQQPQICR